MMKDNGKIGKLKKKTLAIIGFGRFGQMMAVVLKPYLDVCVYNPRDKSRIAKDLGVNYEPSLKRAVFKDIVVLSMPISCLESVLRDIAPHLKPGTLVLDVCSVKEKPARLMKEILPENVDIIATHPLFGPDSTKRDGLHDVLGKKVVLCPLRTDGCDFDGLRKFLEELGFITYVTTPSEHDRQMATAQGLTHYIALALMKMGVGDQDLTTPNYDALLSIIGRLKNDTGVLLGDIQKENLYARKERKHFRKVLSDIEREIDGN